MPADAKTPRQSEAATVIATAAVAVFEPKGPGDHALSQKTGLAPTCSERLD